MAKKKGILKTLVVGVLAVGVIGAGIGTAYHFKDNIKNWFDNIVNPKPTPTPTPTPSQASSGLFVDGNYIENESINYIPETVMFTTSGNVANVSNVNMIGYQLHLNCSVEPSYATNKKLQWSFALVDGTDASVDPYDYYILDVLEDGHDVTVTCKQTCNYTFILRCQSVDGGFTKDIKMYCAPVIDGIEFNHLGTVLQQNIGKCFSPEFDVYDDVKNGLPHQSIYGLTSSDNLNLDDLNYSSHNYYFSFESFFSEDDDFYNPGSNYCKDYLIYQYDFYHDVDYTYAYLDLDICVGDSSSFPYDSRFGEISHFTLDFTDDFKDWAKSNNYLDFINQYFTAFTSVWDIYSGEDEFYSIEDPDFSNPSNYNFLSNGCINLNLYNGLLLQKESLSAENYYKAIRIFNDFLTYENSPNKYACLYDIYIEGGIIDKRDNHIYLTSSLDIYFDTVFADKALVSNVKITNSSNSISGVEGGNVDKPYYVIGKREEQ